MRTLLRLGLVFALPLTAACSKEQPPARPVAAAASSSPVDTAPPPPAPAEASNERDAGATAAPETKMAQGPDAFTYRVLGALSTTKGNVVLSGASLQSALGMLELGAKGATKDELDRVLGLPPDASAHVARAKAETAAWKTSAGKAELAIANRVWVDKRSVLEPAFAKSAADAYGASGENVDFIAAAEPSRKTINAWVAKSTKDRIKDLLPEGSIDATTRLVLTNAIYFKGFWADAFPKAATSDGVFHAEDGDVKRPFMRRKGSYRTAEVNGTEVLELPYKDSDLAMVVLLPKANGLAALERAVAESGLDAFVAPLASGEVRVALPKFTFKWGRSVKPELASVGLRTMFGDSADLSGLRKTTAEPPLYVSNVFHEAFIQVDETGTEAAAATGVVVAVRGISREKKFEADRPFLFAIRSTKTGRVLFMGRLAKPEG